ncbi:MAG: hypothetical protein VYB85_01910 [Candidatus Thermoplasmatota archaeon]|nr:hypothetical protein [Candidatus Thermoplasmatota archaeon]MEC7349459.1 hypothetical protein [Candidatus Thermoplasmatota archaeon]MEC8446206.1 hypothetical protein [Candidatus Thermoplasmatota archaeon]MEC9138442.1 hypothetical protein [Candidatus Thermoplasmatota archaeon]|tara:strand:+ start:282 stop:719 length:438 start_codon:yes stop_codon:yes gene_type:complete
MAEEEEGEQTKINVHTPAPPSERIWMDVYLDQDGRLAKHDWCLDTGIIKNQGGEVAKPKGFYITILNKMKYVLEKELGRKKDSPKISQAQISLILKDLDKVDGFYDKWWRTESSQLETFIKVVQNRRPDLSKRFIIDTVTRTLNG